MEMAGWKMKVLLKRIRKMVIKLKKGNYSSDCLISVKMIIKRMKQEVQRRLEIKI